MDPIGKLNNIVLVLVLFWSNFGPAFYREEKAEGRNNEIRLSEIAESMILDFKENKSNRPRL